MNKKRSLCQPLVLSKFDLPEASQLMTFCEDCACPVSSILNSGKWFPSFKDTTFADTKRWIGGQEVLEFELDVNHHVLFNPLGQGGAVVVNQSARQIFHQFKQPSTLKESLHNWHSPIEEFDSTFKRLVALEMICLCEQDQRPHFQPNQILTAWLHVTNVCNLHCLYCYLTRTDESMDEDVGRSGVEGIIRSATMHKFKAIMFKYAGGEPSLNAQLVLNLHDYAQQLTDQENLQLYGVMLSNGVALSSDFIEALKARGIRVMISLDGIGRKHDVQRLFANGEPSFHLVERTIARLIDHNHPPHLSITVTNYNLQGLFDVVRFALDRNLTFSLNFFRENRDAESRGDLKYEEQAMIKALQEAFKVIEQYLPPWSILGTVLDRGQLLQLRLRPCGVGQDYIVIDHRGRLARCHMDIENTIGDISAPDPLKLIRQDQTGVQNPTVEEKNECRQCSWRYWCSGGCPITTYNGVHRFDHRSPNCNIYKAIYPEALKLEGLRLLKYSI